MSILISKFNSSGVLYDALSGSEYNLDFGNYIHVCYNDDYVYFLKDDYFTTKTVLRYNLLSEVVDDIKYTSYSASIKSIIYNKGKIYGFDGYKVKKYNEEGVLYIKESNDPSKIPSILAYERFDGKGLYKLPKETKPSTIVPLIYSQSKIEDFIIDDDLSYIILHYKNISENPSLPIFIPKVTKFNRYRQLVYSIDVTAATTSAIQNLRVLATDPLSGFKLDIVREFTPDGIKKYPIMLGTNTKKEMFLAKIDEPTKDIVFAKYIVDSSTATLTATSHSFEKEGSKTKINYNLTNYDFLRTKYTKKSIITFKVLLNNIYNNRDVSDVEIEVDMSKFKTEWHHFAFRLDGINGKVDVLCDGKVVGEGKFDAAKYVFQDIFSESFNVGNTYMTNNVSLDEYLNQARYYFVNNITIKQFKVYQKALTNNQIDFLIYNGIKMEDLVVSLPCDQRNHIDTVERQFKFTVPGNKSNFINVHLKNTKIKIPIVQDKTKDIINQEIKKVLPATTQINNISFRNANKI